MVYTFHYLVYILWYICSRLMAVYLLFFYLYFFLSSFLSFLLFNIEKHFNLSGDIIFSLFRNEPITVFNAWWSVDLLAGDCVVFNDYKTLEAHIPILCWRHFCCLTFCAALWVGVALISDPPPSVFNSSLWSLSYCLQLMSRL